MSPSSSRVMATPPAARNSVLRSPWSFAARWASSPRVRVETGPLALGDKLREPARDSPNLLEMARRVREVHDWPVLRVSHGDDRGHHAGPIAEPLEDAKGAIQDLVQLHEERADRCRQDHL